METGDKIIISFIAALCVFAAGIAMGNAYGYKQGYQDGFDRALPLTYASVIKK